MLTYQDALELKEAGYKLPTKYRDDVFVIEGDRDASGENIVYRTPSLEELIIACGEDDIFQLNFPIRGKWNARKGEIHGEGSSPIQAVASLYIALHKHD